MCSPSTRRWIDPAGYYNPLRDKDPLQRAIHGRRGNDGTPAESVDAAPNVGTPPAAAAPPTTLPAGYGDDAVVAPGSTSGRRVKAGKGGAVAGTNNGMARPFGNTLLGN